MGFPSHKYACASNAASLHVKRFTTVKDLHVSPKADISARPHFVLLIVLHFVPGLRVVLVIPSESKTKNLLNKSSQIT